MYRVHICSTCGLFAIAKIDEQQYTCLGCTRADKAFKIVQIYLPYACKLLIQELMAMHIIPRIRVDVKKDKKNQFHI